MGILGNDYKQAMNLAFDLHIDQVRKAGKGTRPYFLHLQAVSSIVLDLDGTEDEAMAAILHDSVEDQAKKLRRLYEEKHAIHGLGDQEAALEHLRELWPERPVADYIKQLSDEKMPKGWKSWPMEKLEPVLRSHNEMKFEKYRKAPLAVRKVKAADVLHNGRSIFQDLRQGGVETWDGFAGGKRMKIWYLEEFAKVFNQPGTRLVAIELTERVIPPLKKAAEAAEL